LGSSHLPSGLIQTFAKYIAPHAVLGANFVHAFLGTIKRCDGCDLRIGVNAP
jgi:hypothetical protein